MNTANPTLDEALRIAASGYRVLPCNQAKRPIIGGWPEAATTGPQQIKDWFANSNYLLAVLTGPQNNLFAVDVDPNGEKWLAENEHRMLCERVHMTKRGRHFLYRFTDALNDVKTTTVGKVDSGVDTRGAGGYLIWWPAQGLGVSGDLDSLTEPPQWLVEELADADRSNKVAKYSYPEIILEGGRNDALASYCGSVWHSGIPIEQLLQAATEFNRARNDPPLPEEEVHSVATSISRYERAKPMSLEQEETEDSLALKFASLNPQLRYVSIWGKWMRWNQTVWQADETLWISDLVRKHLRLFVPYKRVFLKATSVAAVEKLIRSDRRYAATVDQWDADDHLLNTPTGMIDLNDGTSHPPNPKFHMSKSTLVGPGGEAPRWQRFLSEVTDQDIEYQLFLQRMIGYAVSGFTHEHALFFIYGQGGNGKSIFLNSIQAVMGDYAKVASMETFTDSKFERHPTDLAMLQGARMVFAQETESGRDWAESRIKSLTGGDPITARYMRQDFFTYLPKFKLLISGNHLPRLRNVDEAIQRRLHLLPFTCTFNGNDRDSKLADKLVSEYGGILQWIIDGAVAYEQHGLAPPPMVREATEAYFETEDLFKHWLVDCCEQALDACENPSRLFESFKAYAEAANDRAGNLREFRARLRKAGFKPGNSSSKGGRFWQGLILKD
jgi:putative DNA primase/helicase